MNFLEAVKAMQEGKEVINDVSIIYRTRGLYFEYRDYKEKWNLATIQPCHFDYNWEIVEEKKTLSDKINVEDFSSLGVSTTLDVDDVKKALKELSLFFLEHTSVPSQSEIQTKLKEIFGERLI